MEVLFIMPLKEQRWENMDKSSTSLDQLIQEFELYNKVVGKSPKTVEKYDFVLGLFHQYLEDKGFSSFLGDLTLPLVREYVVHLQQRERLTTPVKSGGKGLSPNTIDTHVRSLRAFFHWIYTEGYTKEHILDRLKPPRLPQELMVPLSDSELSSVYSAIDGRTVWGARDLAIVTTLLDTGLRRNELAELQVEDIQLEEGRLKVMGKGRKERIVPFGNSTTRVLIRYYHHFRPFPVYGAENSFFLTVDGTSMTGNAVRLIMDRLAIKSGVRRLHAHLFRHTFAVRFLMNGGNVFSLQQILGHTSLEMVRRYVHLAESFVVTEHRKFSPADALNLKQLRRGNRLGYPTGIGEGKKSG
jgi:site-specific recombinase XerD